MEEVIKFRWGALPEEQREGIKNYISNLIIKLSSDEAVFRREKVFINKLNIILVQVRPPPGTPAFDSAMCCHGCCIGAILTDASQAVKLETHASVCAYSELT